MEKIYYLYRHIRLDKNVPFYIGIGTKRNTSKSDENAYHRAFSNKGRNITWDCIYKKTNIEVEILLESDNPGFISEKEKEFIDLYGQVILDNGTLVNIESGGFTVNKKKRIIPPEEYERRRNKFIQLNTERRGKSHYNGAIPVFVYLSNGDYVCEYKSLIDAGKGVGIHSGTIWRKIRGNKSIKGYFFFPTYRGDKLNMTNLIVDDKRTYYSISTPVYKLNEDGDILAEYKSITDAAEAHGVKPLSIAANLRKGSVNRKGLIFRYK